MRNFTVVDVQQGSPEWLAVRAGRLTASRAADMLAKDRSGKGPGVSRENLKWEQVIEGITGQPTAEKFKSAAMQRGTALEPQAITAYEELTGSLVRTCGFLAHTTLAAGASPDGYLGDFQILISIKCREVKAHAEHLLTGTIPNDALQQMRHELWLTGAVDHHYVSWHPDFPEKLRMRVHVLHAKDLDIPGYGAEVERFLAEVAEAKAKLLAVAA